jgi:hypothetical protein
MDTNGYQYKITGIPTDLNSRKTLTGHAYSINKQQLIKALQGLPAKQITISVTLDVTDDLNRLIRIDLTDPKTWQETTIRY